MMFQFLSKQPLPLNAVDWLRAKVLANHRSPLDSWIKGLFVKFISILYNCSSKIPNLETALNDTSELSLIPKINCKLKHIIAAISLELPRYVPLLENFVQKRGG